jgi:DNA-binding MarR family transcriptional regulator
MSKSGANIGRKTSRQAFETPGQAALVGLLHTADVVRHHLDPLFAAYGLTGQQYNVLRILRGAHPEPLPTMEIAGRMIERAPGITGLLDRLERKGLVSRERCPEDRREVHCSITREGRGLLERLDEPVAHADETILAALDDVEVERLAELLAKLRASLDP